MFLANHNHVLGTLVASAFDSTTCCYPGPPSQHLDLKTKSSESQNGASAASLDYSSPHPVKFAPQLKSFTAAYNLSFAFAKLFISSRSPRLPNAYSQLRFRCVVAPHDWIFLRCSALVRANKESTSRPISKMIFCLLRLPAVSYFRSLFSFILSVPLSAYEYPGAFPQAFLERLEHCRVGKKVVVCACFWSNFTKF
jgi:hypothetical protein